MTAVSDAFASFQTALTAKIQNAGTGKFLPLTGGRLSGQLEVTADILASGDVDGSQVITGNYPMSGPTTGGNP